MTDVSESDGLLSDDRVLAVAILLVGVVGSGLARWFLGNAGYPTFGSIVFVSGYAAMVFVLWYGWVRPMDITGPGGP